VETPVKGLSALVENHLFLRQLEWKGELRRVLAILKTRESGHDPSLRELVIGDSGIQLGGRFDSTGAVLTDPGLPLAQRSTRRSAARKKRGGRK
jgi:circadian clock protein KaiC